MNFLETILAAKREEIAERKRSVLRSRLEDMPKYALPRRSLRAALAEKDMAVIAEIKKASPSRSVIRADFDPLAIARRYLQGGAHAISVLTDERFFQGRLEYIERMRHFVDVPILRKDFILDAYQLHEARAFGADAVLLIAAALSPGQVTDLAGGAAELGLECLVEVHHEDELEGLDLRTLGIIGVNNRDLMTFETDMMTSVRLRKSIPAEVPIVSESGITCAADLRLLQRHGIHAVLIGEYFMRAEDPGAALQELLAEATT
jgi:indole-3-glycerol phosphate synthase